ncbi:MAG TPA: hypothetical protein VGJ61_03430 [Solirubrobacterales bacterium]|jgi:hypothetical protein
MEAHVGTLGIDQLPQVEVVPVERKAKRLRFFRKAIRAHEPRPRSVPGSEHTHLVLPPKAY